MELIYRAWDGKEFKTAEDCINHEEAIRGGVKMWDTTGRRTDDVSMAVVISIRNEKSMLAFHQMCYEYAETELAGKDKDAAKRLIGGLEEDISGCFYWDDYKDEYRWIDEDLLKPLVSLAREEGIV